MNLKSLLLLLSVFIILACNSIQTPELYKTTKNYPDELQQLHQNLVNDLLEENIDTREITGFYQDLKDDGTWADIDYPSQTRGSWSPRNHLVRLLEIATLYQKPGSGLYQKKEVSVKIHAALNHWLVNDFQSPNWWHPVIGTPMLLNPVLILMEPELSEEQWLKAMPILNRCEIGQTGQNKVWQSGNVLMSSLLTRNPEMVKKAAESIQEELVVGTGEGVQPDWSYHQHGPQLQFGNYGLSYVGDMIQWISVLRNTPFAFNEEKVAILRNYLLEGQQWVIWKNQMDISACGRQIGPDQPAAKAATLLRNFEQMKKLDPEFSGDYEKARRYINLSGNKHFWRSDIQVQRSPGYYFSVKMASERVIGAESCNSENLQGFYLGDGATYLYQTGNEYRNIFPFWDWKKIPGTTTLQDDEPLPVLTASGYRIPTEFVGGVSDGENGIAVLEYNRLGLQAKKAWFMFGDKIICLGSGITSRTGLPVTTSVNQSFLNGRVESKKDGENFTWILHDSIGYFFTEPAKLTLKTDEVSGKWTDVTILLSEETIKANLFKLWVEHGVNPKNKSYGYILVPKATPRIMAEMENQNPFNLVNENDRQEIISTDKHLAGIIFYKPGKSDVLGGIEVDRPCVLMVKQQENEIQLSVADPTQKLSGIKVNLTGNYTGESAVFNKGETEVKISLPQNEMAGKTVTQKLLKQ